MRPSRFTIAVGVATLGLLAAIALTAALPPTNAAAQALRAEPSPGDMWDPYWMEREQWGPQADRSGIQQRMLRHWTFIHQTKPTGYEGARNPLAPNAPTLSDGRTLYAEHCASCHGKTGMGNGEEANALNPSPALLAFLIQVPMSVDEYLMWSIADGGAAFATDMPAYKDTLTEEEIWQIVTFMRAGFPVYHAPE